MNIKMQCCGIILLVVIFFFYYRQKKINLNTEKAFLRIFLVITIGLTLDILSMVVLHYADSLPELVVDTVCKSYVASLVLVALNGVLYVCADIFGQSKMYRKCNLIYCILAGIGIVLIFALPIYKSVEDKSNTYTYGPSTLVTYAFCLGFFAVMIFMIIRHKSKMNPKRREAVQVWIALWLAAAIIQFLDKKLLLVGYAGAISVMIIYLKLENPEINLDRQTGLFNQAALIQYMRQMFHTEEDFSLLIMQIPLPLMRNNPEEDKKIKMEIVGYISSLPDSIAFKGAEDEIILILPNREQAEEVKEILEERFESGWGKNNSILVNPYFLLMPSAHIVSSAEDILPCLQYARQNSMEFAETGEAVLNEDLTSQMYEERQIEQLLAEAIKNDWVEVYYQPIYSIEEKQFVSAEALSRIIDEDGNVVSPGLFIDVAEKNGMILKLGELVFKKVCQFIASHPLKEMGIRYIEVNLSTIQGSYEHLADSFIEIMEWYHVDPSMINLEITESGSINAKKILLDNMNRLIRYGVRFSLDDFGTGQSNLNYIVEMPVDIVKFDRTMTGSYFDKGKAKYVMDAAIHMIHGMKLQIVSEGIETKEQLDTMENLGIRYIQGYYFSKPVPSEDFLSFLEKHNVMEQG